MDLRNNASNVRINEPFFIFGLTNLLIQETCMFRNNEQFPTGVRQTVFGFKPLLIPYPSANIL